MRGRLFKEKGWFAALLGDFSANRSLSVEYSSVLEAELIENV